MAPRTSAAPLSLPAVPPAEEEVGEALWGLFRLIWLRGQAECRDLGLTVAQARLLVMLGTEVPWEPSDLARHLELSRQAMSSAVNHLEREGLVSRVHSPTDRRRVFVEFTPRGRRIFLRLRAGHHRMHQQINRRFSGAEREAAVRLLATIHRELVGDAEILPYRCTLCRPSAAPKPRAP